MLLSAIHSRFLGSWKGENRLILSWLPNPEHVSNTTLTVTPAAKGKFLSFNYTWSHDETDHEGVLLVGNENPEGTATAAFVDSWHMGGAVMFCKGRVADDGVVHLLGSYEAPPGPDWGWRFEIRPGDGELTLLMFNVSPDSAEELAVQADYKRG